MAERVRQRIGEEVAIGRQVFVVCPRISANDEVVPGDLPNPSVEELSGYLADGPLQGLRIGVLHGRLAAGEKDSVMAAFAAGELDVLVATTVIEVGVDAAQRVHDGDHGRRPFRHQPAASAAWTSGPRRLSRGLPAGHLHRWHDPGRSAGLGGAVAATRDGFELAEVDLEQRREGDVLGASQAGGRSTLRLLRVLDDAELPRVSRDRRDAGRS